MDEKDARKQLAALARETIAAAPDVEQAVDELRRRAKHLRKCLIESAWRAILQDYVYRARGEDTRQLKYPPANPPRMNAQAMLDAEQTCILDRFMSCGKRLREASGSDVQVEIEREGELSRGHALNVKFYAEIAARVKGDQVVGEVVTDRVARNIHKKVYGEARPGLPPTGAMPRASHAMA